MLPAHLRPYPLWASWIDGRGRLIFLAGSLLIADEISPGFWTRLSCMLVGVLIWDSIFSRVRDVLRARKEHKTG